MFFFFKQKTAYEMRISDWSSDVCSSDLLSGIATMTQSYVARILGTGAILLDTRKTIPGLRALEKYATRMGGATNHRMGLWDAAMIKDNHVAVAGSIGEAVRRAVAAGIDRIIVEVDSVDQIEPALAAGATHLLLDNMPPPVLRGAVTLVGGRVPTEASGGVTLETIRPIAETGDRKSTRLNSSHSCASRMPSSA